MTSDGAYILYVKTFWKF